MIECYMTFQVPYSLAKSISSTIHYYQEALVQTYSVKKVFLEISPPATLLKKRLWHRCFPVNFVKFLRTPFLTEHLWVNASNYLHLLGEFPDHGLLMTLRYDLFEFTGNFTKFYQQLRNFYIVGQKPLTFFVKHFILDV